MPEATFNNHRTATRTQRPTSTTLRPDAPRPLRSYFSSPSSRSLSRCNRDRAACPDAIGIASWSASEVALRKNCTHQTNPFASPTSIPVFRPAPYAIVKLGRAGKHGRAGKLGRPPSSPSSFPFFVSWCLCGNPSFCRCVMEVSRIVS